MPVVRAKSAAMVLLVLVLMPCHAFARLLVYVSVVPQKYFVERVGGTLVDVRVMVPTNADPATYEPTPAQIADAAGSRIYVRAGFEAETAWVNRILSSNRNIMVVKSDTGIDKPLVSSYLLSEAGDRKTPPGDSAAEKALPHDTRDPNIWLSPPLVKRQARQILRGLALMDRPNTNVYHGYYLEFYQEINRLNSRLQGIMAKAPGVSFIAIPPAWGFFADTYGARQFAVGPDLLTADPGAYDKLVSAARKNGIRLVLASPAGTTGLPGRLARDIGGELISADPFAENWGKNLITVAQELVGAVQ